MITVAISDGIMVVTMDRPEARNALVAADYETMHRAFNDACDDADVGVVVVTGAGDTFCGGQDLKELGSTRPEHLASVPFHAYIEALARCRKPVIGAVEGSAVGVGFTMLLHMDLVVASSQARFRTPFVRLGATAEAGSSVLLPALLGPRLAAKLLLTGDWLHAKDRGAEGLLTEIVAPGTSLPRAMELAARIAALPRHSVESIKRLLIAGREDAVLRSFARERAELVRIAGLLEAGLADAPFADGRVHR
jgi:enoyl-CoA hydratase/carnithine racemase